MPVLLETGLMKLVPKSGFLKMEVSGSSTHNEYQVSARPCNPSRRHIMSWRAKPQYRHTIIDTVELTDVSTDPLVEFEDTVHRHQSCKSAVT